MLLHNCRTIDIQSALAVTDRFPFPDHSAILYYSKYLGYTGLSYMRFLWHPRTARCCLAMPFLAK